MSRRHVPKYGSLTSLLDVLFILMFASLAQAAALVERAREAPKTDKRSKAPSTQTKLGTEDAGVTAAPDAGAVDGAVAEKPASLDAGAEKPARKHRRLYAKAVARLTQSLERRRPIYAYVSSLGVLEVLRYAEDGEDNRVQVSEPLVKRSQDPDIEWVYANRGICEIVRSQLKLTTLENELIIVMFDKSKDEQSQDDALVRGLLSEPSRCGHKGLLDIEPPKGQP